MTGPGWQQPGQGSHGAPGGPGWRPSQLPYGYGPPGPVGLPPRQRMSRGLLATVIAVPLVVLLAAAATFGVLGFRAQQARVLIAGERLSAPEMAGGLMQLHDQAAQSRVALARSKLAQSGYRQPVAAAYGGPDGRGEVLVYGGTMTVRDPDGLARRYLAQLPGSQATVTSSDPGRFGGSLRCRPWSTSATVCVAVDGGAVLVGDLTGMVGADPGTVLRRLRDDMEHR